MTHNTSDPDLNLHSFNDHGIFTIEELNELSTIVKPHLSALHLNIRSLSKHFDELCNLLDSTPFEFDLIACSETCSFRINIRKFCPTVIGCYYWNDIPLSIRNKPTRKHFKKALYQYYFAQY